MATYIKSGLLVGVSLGAVASIAVACMVALGVPVGHIWHFVACPGLLAVAATSDAVSKPPSYQTWMLFVAINFIWYVAFSVAIAALVGLFKVRGLSNV